jgi:ATP-dependent RNA helicase DDX10/DBP4
MVAPGFTGRTRPTKVKKRENIKKRSRDDVDVEKLEQAVQALVCISRHTGAWIALS